MMNNIDLQELSRVALLLFSNIIVAFVTHFLTKRREQEKNKKNVIITCDLIHRVGQWWTSSIAEDDYEVIVITAVNDSHRPITITDAGFLLENGTPFRPTNYPKHMWQVPILKDDGEIAYFSFRISDAINVMVENNSIIVSVFVLIGTGEKYIGRVEETTIEKLKSLL